MENNRT